MALHDNLGIRFFFEAPIDLRDRRRLKEFIQLRLKAEGRTLASLNYIFCSDERLLHINKEYLQHDYYTDIISFELSTPGQPVEAEIYISVDRVRENAAEQRETIKRELHRVIFHGALHLSGYKDKTSAQSKEMRAMEEKWLAMYLRNVPRGNI